MIRRKMMKTLLKFGCKVEFHQSHIVDFTWGHDVFWFAVGEHYYDEPSDWHWYEREVS